MLHKLTAALTLAVITLGLLAPSTAHARRGLAIISTGDKMFDIADATAESPARQQWSDAVVAYHCQHFGLFWVPLWTWDGQFVVYSDSIETYQDGTVEELAEITGVPADKFEKPFLYSFPLGLLIIALLVVAAVLYGVFARDDDDEDGAEPQPGAPPAAG